MYLGIDTSSTILCFGLWEKSGHSETFELGVERDHAKRIIIELDHFLDNHKVQKQYLQGIGVGLGPGSYTGTRVGIATAKGLAQGLDIPVSGCSSLEAIAARCLKDNEEALVTIDARRDNFYYGIYQKKADLIILNSAIAKESRSVLENQYAHLNHYEAITPDASYIAKQAASLKTSDLAAIYL